jgi:hypothetical protein
MPSGKRTSVYYDEIVDHARQTLLDPKGWQYTGEMPYGDKTFQGKLTQKLFLRWSRPAWCRQAIGHALDLAVEAVRQKNLHMVQPGRSPLTLRVLPDNNRRHALAALIFEFQTAADKAKKARIARRAAKEAAKAERLLAKQKWEERVRGIPQAPAEPLVITKVAPKPPDRRKLPTYSFSYWKR